MKYAKGLMISAAGEQNLLKVEQISLMIKLFYIIYIISIKKN